MLIPHAQVTARHFMLTFAVCVCLQLLTATPAEAQRNRPASNPRGRVNENALRDWSREHMTEQINKQFEKQRISLLPQIKEDFAHMQVVNNEMMRAVFVADTHDYKIILDTTDEIRKRARRLKINLMLPEPDDDEQIGKLPAQQDDKALRKSLLLLDNSIMSFVNNPLFQKTDVLDTKLSTKASHDLKSIIELSAAIRKSVERLSKIPASQENPDR